MKISQWTRVTFVISFSILLNQSAFAQSATSGAGRWEGKIVMPERDVAVIVDLDRDSAGAWIGSLTFPKTTTVNAPLSSVSSSERNVRFQLVGIEGNPKFEGTLSADGATLAGTAANAKGAVPFELQRSGQAQVSLPPPSSMLTPDFEGEWDGALTAGARTMQVGLKLSALPDGRAAAVLTTVDDGNKTYPVSSVVLNGKQLQLEMRVISGMFSGVLGANGEIAGEFKQGGASLPLTFKRK